MNATPGRTVYVTPTETIALLTKHGIRLRKGLGQHFLVDNNILLNILDAARISPDELVLEVGPGIGSLTKGLADRASSVIAVEIDERMVSCFRENVVAANVTLLQMDALKLERSDLAGMGGPTKLVANLPYNIAVRLVLQLLERLPELEEAVVMVQREVADRMVASPGTKSYGAVTVKLAYYGEARRLFPVPRSVFVPPPRVDSAVVRLARSRRDMGARARLFSLVEMAFAQRRKTLANALASGLTGLTKDRIDGLLRSAGVDPAARAEELTVADYLRIEAFLPTL